MQRGGENADEAQAHAVEIGDRIWWVGHHIPGDVFQCHVYLVEHGDQSVLIDPGSKLTFAHTLRKIEEVIPFGWIRYFICHHQDPDITGALPLIEEMVSRDDAVVVTHWRAEALLRHYGLKFPFWRVEDHDWRLDLGGRALTFTFTPYLHFPGAYCSFDESSGILFSSDLFGGFTKADGWTLYAEDERHFEAIRPFHEHYMPSREILVHTLLTLERLPIRTIAPQHGSIIPERLVPFMFNRLKELECGLYLLTRKESDIGRLMELNTLIQDSLEAMVTFSEFRDIASRLHEMVARVLPLESLEFCLLADDGTMRCMSPRNRYRGETSPPPPFLSALLASGEEARPPRVVEAEGRPLIAIPLLAREPHFRAGVALLWLERPVAWEEELKEVLERIREPLSVAVEREAVMRHLEGERDAFYERASRDALTGLYTRFYMQEAAARLLALHDRNPDAGVAVAIADIDHFKRVNDRYGHPAGDEVLRAVAGAFLDDVREVDIAVRYGGEELALFMPARDAAAAEGVVQRLRAEVAATRFPEIDPDLRVTFSAGIAVHRQGETLAELLPRADAALYEAKRTGRNRVCVAK